MKISNTLCLEFLTFTVNDVILLFSDQSGFSTEMEVWNSVVFKMEVLEFIEEGGDEEAT